MLTFPEIETTRLILNKPSLKDVPKIVEYAGSPAIAEMTLNLPHPYEEKDAIFWLNSANQGFKNKSQFTFAIRDGKSREFIGGIGLKVNQRYNIAEFGYWIAEPFWNLGYATEALEAVLKFGFEKLELNKIYATHLIENPASGKVMIKNGMIKEGELKDHIKKEGKYKSVIQYRLTRSEYKEQK